MSLQYGHRISVDLDIFTDLSFDLAESIEKIKTYTGLSDDEINAL